MRLRKQQGKIIWHPRDLSGHLSEQGGGTLPAPAACCYNKLLWSQSAAHHLRGTPIKQQTWEICCQIERDWHHHASAGTCTYCTVAPINTSGAPCNVAPLSFTKLKTFANKWFKNKLVLSNESLTSIRILCEPLTRTATVDLLDQELKSLT